MVSQLPSGRIEIPPGRTLRKVFAMQSRIWAEAGVFRAGERTLDEEISRWLAMN